MNERVDVNVNGDNCSSLRAWAFSSVLSCQMSIDMGFVSLWDIFTVLTRRLYNGDSAIRPPWPVSMPHSLFVRCVTSPNLLSCSVSSRMRMALLGPDNGGRHCLHCPSVVLHAGGLGLCPSTQRRGRYESPHLYFKFIFIFKHSSRDVDVYTEYLHVMM